jgi:hypothetical protein
MPYLHTECLALAISRVGKRSGKLDFRVFHLYGVDKYLSRLVERFLPKMEATSWAVVNGGDPWARAQVQLEVT